MADRLMERDAIRQRSSGANVSFGPQTRADFERFAWIIAMDQANAADLRAMAPKASTARIELFRSFDEASPQNAEVPDPWGHPMDAFREVYTLCARASAGLVRAIVATAG